jgi:Tfp pilus assembly protein PilN
MIRVNLLEGTAEHRVSVQKTKVAARRGQQLFMLASALLIFAIAIGVDHLWTNNAHADAQTELEREQEEAKKLEADIQRKNELEAELKQVEERIKMIKQLRAEQKGPVAMMSAINERMPAGQADFRLEVISPSNHRLLAQPASDCRFFKTVGILKRAFHKPHAFNRRSGSEK